MDYWDCPILNYSSIYLNDYGVAKSICGKISLFLEKKKKAIQEKKKNQKNKKKI